MSCYWICLALCHVRPKTCTDWPLCGPKDAHGKICTWYNVRFLTVFKFTTNNTHYIYIYIYICKHYCWVCLSRPKTVQTYYIGRGLTMYIFLWNVFEAYCNIRNIIFMWRMSRCSLWRTGHKILAMSYELESEGFWLCCNM